MSISAATRLAGLLALVSAAILSGCRPGATAHSSLSETTVLPKATALPNPSSPPNPSTLTAKPTVPTPPPALPQRSLKVTATAYNSLKRQTDSRPNDAAWGDSLEPGLRSIAVSRDLLLLGLKPGMIITIDSLDGRYIILDKMDRRWKKRIDIYYDRDEKGARRWGERKVVIHWRDTTDARTQTLGRAKTP